MSLEIEKYKIENEHRLAQWKAETENKLAEWKFKTEFSLKSLEYTVGFANITIRSLMLANGGALVALLAFFGNTWKDSHPIILQSIPSMKAFLLGLFLSILVGALSYFAQYFFTHSKDKIGACFQILAIISAIGSLGSFGCGSWHITEVFSLAQVVKVEQTIN